jgi:8-oxo-dGTP pyrophosphatase MutT (NUDIX family)
MSTNAADAVDDAGTAPSGACVVALRRHTAADGRRAWLVLTVSRQHDPDDVGLPAGGIEPGETPERAGERELEEETGYVLGGRRLEPLLCADCNTGQPTPANTVTFWVAGPALPAAIPGPRAGERGVVAWRPLDVLLRGSKTFPAYNRNVWAALTYADDTGVLDGVLDE